MTWRVFNEGAEVGKHERVTISDTSGILRGRDRNDKIQAIYSPRGWTSVKYED